ncbi:bifunctional oligoribonuclease/PAP phosphatase NrnA [Saprospiraceae bacterium]|nr:bifunctional oligoribonuclease/PAP phosphatase NrnA [Saprospiraceae bacterium]
MRLTEQEISEIKDLLAFPKNIAIITHRNPDGDALGSSLGLRFFLDKFNHNTKVILPSEYPSNFAFLGGVQDCIVYDLKQAETKEVLKNADIIFCLDFNALDRVDKIGPYIEDAKATKILIDHHLDPEPFVDYTYSDISASSTCELIHQFIHQLGAIDKLDARIGEALFTGIITDTGSFKYSTNPNTYRVAAELKEVGVDDYTLQDKIFNTLTEKQLRLLGHALVNRMEVIKEHGAGIIALTKQDYFDYEIQRGDTEGIVNFILMMDGIKVAAFLREQPTIVKMSFRSKGDISVQALARDNFKGGGHKNASGGAAYAKLEDVVNRFKTVLPNYL